MFIDDRSIRETTFTRCRFVDNVTGGAPIDANGDSLCHITVSSCAFLGNRCANFGPSALWVGAPMDPAYDGFPETRRRAVVRIENTLIAGNIGAWGFAVGADNADVSVVNCTIADNRKYREFATGDIDTVGGVAVSLGSGPSVIVVNNIFWNNGGPETFGPNASVTYCDVAGGWAGQGNIDGDPLFVDPANGDYGLQPASPAIGAGTQSPSSPTSRSRPDMGAIPFTWQHIPTGTDAGTTPALFALEQNSPNPFNPSTVIRFSVPVAEPLNLVVYDLSGRIVRTLVRGTLQGG